jgi:hypothetical protein
MLVEFWEAPPFWTLLINTLNFYKKEFISTRNTMAPVKQLSGALDEHILAIG